MKRLLITVAVLLAFTAVWFFVKRRQQHPDFTRSTEMRIEDVYYVRAYRHGAYIIEHKGHRLTAKCRESRS